MGQIHVTRNLGVSTEQLWKTIVDPATWESWMTIHAGWLAPPPAVLTPGTKLVEKVVMLGMANKLDWVVDEVVPNARLSIDGTGMAGVTSRFSFVLTPAGDTTDVAIDAEFSGSLIVGALAKAVEKDAASNLDDSLDKLSAVATA